MATPTIFRQLDVHLAAASTRILTPPSTSLAARPRRTWTSPSCPERCPPPLHLWFMNFLTPCFLLQSKLQYNTYRVDNTGNTFYWKIHIFTVSFFNTGRITVDKNSTFSDVRKGVKRFFHLFVKSTSAGSLPEVISIWSSGPGLNLSSKAVSDPGQHKELENVLRWTILA